MSQLDFCRTAHHAGYIAVLSAVLPIVKDSNAGSRMLLHQMLRDAPPLAHLPSRNLAVQSRRYFVLRLLPALVPRLDTCLAEPALWDFLGACIREAPGSTQAPIARLGHEAVAMALEVCLCLCCDPHRSRTPLTQPTDAPSTPPSTPPSRFSFFFLRSVGHIHATTQPPAAHSGGRHANLLSGVPRGISGPVSARHALRRLRPGGACVDEARRRR